MHNGGPRRWFGGRPGSAWVALVFFLLGAHRAAAISMGDPECSRVRAVSATLLKALETGYAYSPTFRDLIDLLNRSNVVVHVEWGDVNGLSGALRLAGTAGGQRYLRVFVSPLMRSRDLVVALGHELFHAVEIARAPDVVDAATLRAHFERIGRSSPTGYETAAARRTSARIAAELDLAAEASYVLALTLAEGLEGPGGDAGIQTPELPRGQVHGEVRDPLQGTQTPWRP